MVSIDDSIDPMTAVEYMRDLARSLRGVDLLFLARLRTEAQCLRAMALAQRDNSYLLMDALIEGLG